MPRPEYLNLSFKKEAYNKLRHKFDSLKIVELQGLSFTQWTELELDYALNRLQFFKKNMPKLSLVATTDNALLIKDDDTQIVTQVIMKKSKLFCSADKSENCIHVQYAIGFPQLNKLISAELK